MEEQEEEEEEGGGGGGVDEKMKGTGGEVKENSRLEERGWNRNVWREWRLNSGRWAGGFLLLFTVHVNLFFSSSYFKPEPQSPNLDDLPCGEYIMNATLLSVDHNALQGNLFPVSARA